MNKVTVEQTFENVKVLVREAHKVRGAKSSWGTQSVTVEQTFENVKDKECASLRMQMEPLRSPSDGAAVLSACVVCVCVCV